MRLSWPQNAEKRPNFEDLEALKPDSKKIGLKYQVDSCSWKLWGVRSPPLSQVISIRFRQINLPRTWVNTKIME